ncbi:MAG: 4Fe-4S cluster-binding domain-containing protein [Clostridium sp.]|nr:4Fe-4S cluster-binding domain-containing protein [Clostridium sp.]
MNESLDFIKKDKLYIRFLVAVVGQACNLRCRDCANFAPFAPKETLRYEVNDIIEHLKIITDCSRIRLLQIQGGEPFVYPQLGELLDFVQKCSEIEKCLIATNGTVLPNVSPQLLQHKKFIVRISNYPVAVNISKKIQEWLQSNSIRYEVYHFVSKEDKWFDMGKWIVRALFPIGDCTKSAVVPASLADKDRGGGVCSVNHPGGF